MIQPHYIDREAVALLVSRLRATTTTDHERGCQGREYACSCGWDEETMAIATEAADMIEALSRPMEAVAWREKVALDLLAANQNCELDYGYDDAVEGDVGRWRVFRVNGGRNDREWTLIGTGATPTDAILQALAVIPAPAEGTGG